MSKISEVAGQLTAMNEQLGKAKGEIINRIEALEEALGDVDLPEEAGEALSALMATVQALDDLNPDAPQPEPVPEPQPEPQPEPVTEPVPSEPSE